MKKKGLSAAKAKKILKDGYVKGKPLTEKQKKFFGSIADGATPLKKINGGWLDKYNDGGSVQPNYNDSNVSLPPGFKGWGYDNSPSGYNPAWNGPVAQNGIELNKKYIDSTLNANMDKRWVQRLYEKNPEFYLEGQTEPSTHFMEDGDGYVYPRVMEGDDKQLKAVSREEGRAQGIKFPNDKIAQWFAKNYKKGTNVLKEYQMGGSLPGATGMMYARTSGTTPEEPTQAKNGGRCWPGYKTVAGKTPFSKGSCQKAQNGQDVNFDSVQRAVRNVESLDGKLMLNPESTATGLYGQRFSEIRNDYPGTRREFSKDTVAQKEFFKRRFYDGLEASETTSLLQDANDLYNDYSPQIKNFPYSKEDLAVLSNFIGRGGTRKYLGYAIRDGKPLAEALPNVYGPNAKQSNKTPEEYLEKARKYYQNGGDVPKAQGGIVMYGTPEYKKAYEEGTFADVPNPLDEVLIYSGVDYEKYPYYNDLSAQQRKYFNDDGPIGRGVRRAAQTKKGLAEDTRDMVTGMLVQQPLAALQTPQSLMVEGIEALRGRDANFLNALTFDTQRTPSEVFNVENPYGAFALDAITDPMNLVGAGVADDVLKLGLKQGLKNTAVRNVDNVKQVGKYLTTKTPLRNAHNYNPFAGITTATPKKLKAVGVNNKPKNFKSEINSDDFSMPPGLLEKIKKSDEARKATEFLKQDLMDPETIRRAEALGVDPEIFEQARKNLTVTSDTGEKSWYNSPNLHINIDSNQIGTSSFNRMLEDVMSLGKSPNFTGNEIAAHETGHLFQDQNYWKKAYPHSIPSGNKKILDIQKRKDPDGYKKMIELWKDYSTRDTAPTKIDEMLGELTKRKDLVKVIDSDSRTAAENLMYFKNATNRYGTAVDNSIERLPMFREYRQGMRDAGILKNKWDEITPEAIDAFYKLKPENRINSFMEMNDKNKKLLKDVGKIAPIGVGVASQTEFKNGGVIEDDRGQWAYPGEITKINSNNITMKGVNYPVLGISDTGDTQMMYPNEEYQYDGNSVTEFPMAQKGKTITVNSKNDPRYKAYQDSLKLSNTEKKMYESESGLSYDDLLSTPPFSTSPSYGYTESGKPLYGYKPKQEVIVKKSRPKQQIVTTLKSKDIVQPEMSVEDFDIHVPVVDYWNVTKEVNQNLGSHKKTFRVRDEAELERLKRQQEIDEQTTTGKNNKLIIIPNYNSGRMRKVNISAKNGSLVELDQLTNFTNYNTPQPGGWLDKYN